MWAHGKRKHSNIPSNVLLIACLVQLEGGFVLPLHERNHLRETQFSAPGASRRWDFRKSRAPAGGAFPDVSALPQVGVYSRVHGRGLE